MCNHEEDFRGIAKYKHKYTAVDKYVIGICLLAITLGVVFIALCLYQLVLSL
jgi:hypothetical protein